MNVDYLSRSFWSHVDRRGPDECWPWTQSTGSHGYGQTWDGTSVLVAHRVAYVLTHGDPGTYTSPSGRYLPLRVRHRCPGGPNRICCNPAHLSAGTDKDNADDRADDGNTFRGEIVSISKLTESTVCEARSLSTEGWSIAALARRYGVSNSTMRSAVTGATWAHVLCERSA